MPLTPEEERQRRMIAERVATEAAKARAAHPPAGSRQYQPPQSARRNGGAPGREPLAPQEGPLGPEPPPHDGRQEQTDAPGPLRFTLRSFDELHVQMEVEYLVKGVIPRRGTVLVWGEPKCGKSFWVFDLMLHVALGRLYRGHRVHQHEIVYIALEGQAGFPDRAAAFRQKHLKPGETVPKFKLCTIPLNLISDHKQLIENIRRQSIQPGGVVIDTLNRSLHGSENDPKDMAAYYRAAEAIQLALDCVVIIIHHCGWEGGHPRGMSSQPAAVDVQIKVERDAVGRIIATVELAKDMASGATITSTLEVVELGTDQDGDPKTSCAVVEAEVQPAGTSTTANLTKMERLAYRALADAVNDRGREPPSSERIPATAKVVTLDEWRRHFYAVHTGEQEAKKKAFQRASQDLVLTFKVCIWEDQAWLI